MGIHWLMRRDVDEGKCSHWRVKSPHHITTHLLVLVNSCRSDLANSSGNDNDNRFSFFLKNPNKDKYIHQTYAMDGIFRGFVESIFSHPLFPGVLSTVNKILSGRREEVG